MTRRWNLAYRSPHSGWPFFTIWGNSEFCVNYQKIKPLDCRNSVGTRIHFYYQQSFTKSGVFLLFFFSQLTNGNALTYPLTHHQPYSRLGVTAYTYTYWKSSGPIIKHEAIFLYDLQVKSYFSDNYPAALLFFKFVTWCLLAVVKHGLELYGLCTT